MMFNPGPATEIQVGDILVVLGEHSRIVALENEV
jgi:K+/H+ antiporter YhaU regulatory subunit KhtT